MTALKRRPGRPRHEKITIAEHWRREILAQLEASTGIEWPSPKYRDDPVGFAHDILGVELWHRQVEILESVRDHKYTAVCSGNKGGKGLAAGILALWWVCSFDNARVELNAPNAELIRKSTYHEVKRLVAGAGVCLACKKDEQKTGVPAERPCPHSALLDGTPAVLPQTGYRTKDGREIVGRTATSREAARGLSSPNTLIIIDEATGYKDELWEGKETSVAGGGKILALSNPTKTHGWFFRIFHGDLKDAWNRVQFSTEENPNFVHGREVIPGLAEKDWIEAQKKKGPKNYAELVTGQFLLREEGRIFPLGAIQDAINRWHDCTACEGGGNPDCGTCSGTGSLPASTGPLVIGVDPAGDTGTGDDSCFAIRRGKKVIELVEEPNGLDEDAHLDVILDLIEKYTGPREIPVVIVDVAGSVGARLKGRILAHLSEARRNKSLRSFDFCPIQSGFKATREVRGYETARDELAANLALSIREGLALPKNEKLIDELVILEWYERVDKKLKLTPKREIKKIIGRSPDRYDAVALCAWTPDSLIQADKPSAGRASPAPTQKGAVPQIGNAALNARFQRDRRY